MILICFSLTQSFSLLKNGHHNKQENEVLEHCGWENNVDNNYIDNNNVDNNNVDNNNADNNNVNSGKNLDGNNLDIVFDDRDLG